MSTAFQEQFNKALADFVRDRKWGPRDIDCDVVTGYEDYTYNGGYCSTCSYEEARMRIFYKTVTGEDRVYEYNGSFINLIEDLTRADPEDDE